MPEGKSTREHKRTAPHAVRVNLITCSTSRFQKMERGEETDDPSGDFIIEELSRAGHKASKRELIPDDIQKLRSALVAASEDADVDVVIVSGGTGIAPRDVTVEAVEGLFDKKIDGFGELFRQLSYDEIGAAAMLSRAIAGVLRGKVVFCLPGSIDATKLAITRLVIPEIGHMVGHAKE